MTAQDIIAAKRDGLKHTKAELEFWAQGVADHEIPDYQIAAWLMAAYLHPLDADETAWLTLAMAGSGNRLDLSGLPKPWVDKHSTGGVGDKTSIVLLPLLAACGLTLIKMSGRGLGITGGTVDKLLSVPGFRMDLSTEELKAQAAKIGVAITGQTPDLAPADKVLYAIRDATATVASIPLIVSSILSKKIAGGAETVVLDVKAGSGAFMKTVDEARRLAAALTETARLAGLHIRLAITDMSQPLGRTVGNALEIEEAGAVLTGNEPSRFANLCIELAGLTLAACGASPGVEAGKEKARQVLYGGFALQKAQQWFEAQGADPAVLVRPEKLPQAPVRKRIEADADGWIAEIRADEVGRTVIALGGGREKKEDTIAPEVGVEVHLEVGREVRKGQPVFTVHARDEATAEAAARSLRDSLRIGGEAVQPIWPVIETI
ncbi:MAG TPA: thymidine phosphorylase [Fimbriimonadaceae bacterium]|nr:thymidine phosphorylase [Fimbriimonadaceae bacterium]